MTSALSSAISAIPLSDLSLAAAFAGVLALGAALQWAFTRSRARRRPHRRGSTHSDRAHSGQSGGAASGRSDVQPDLRRDGAEGNAVAGIALAAQPAFQTRPETYPATPARGEENAESLQAVQQLTTELRTLKKTFDEWSEDFVRRLERVEREVRPVAVMSTGLIDLPAGRSTAPTTAPAPGPLPAYESGRYEPGSGGGAALAVEVPAGAMPVEVRDDQVRESASYPPEAYLALGSPARLFLNTEIQMSEAAVRRFIAFFEFPPFQGGSSFFRTRRPAEVSWNGSQGTCLARGAVEVL